MQTSEEIKHRLNHGAHELHQVLQLLATLPGRIQTASNEIQVCNDRAELIGPTINALNHEIKTLKEEMTRVYSSSRNSESNMHLKQENAQLKRELAALQQTLRDEVGQHQARLAESVRSDAAHVQRIQSLERFDTLLKTKINEMKEQHDSAIIDNTNLRDTIAGLKNTVQTLQSTSGDHHTFNPTADTPAATGDSYASYSKEIVPGIAAHPVSAGLYPGTKEASQIAIHPQSRPKARGIVRGTVEANESFARMKRALASSPANIDSNTTATPKSRLNPTVREFTPSNGSSKDSANSGSVQASPSKTEINPSGTASNTKDGSISPHLHHASELSVKEKSITPNREFFATSTQNKIPEETEPVKTTSLKPRVLPHLRHLTSVIHNHDADPKQVQRSSNDKNKENTIKGTDLMMRELAVTGKKENKQVTSTPGAFAKFELGLQAWLDTQEKAYAKKPIGDGLASAKDDVLIEIDSNHSPKAQKKPAPLPPGFVPTSMEYIPKPYRMVQSEEAIPEDNPYTDLTETEEDAVCIPGFKKILDSVKTKYANGEPLGPPAKIKRVYVDEGWTYNPPKPTGNRKLGAFLDEEVSKMILKPRLGIKMPAQDWKAVRKDGKVVYVL